MCEWWKQLYGESEGKDNKGLFPASVVFSTDLHSMGQYIQQGSRSLFETVVLFDKAKQELYIGNDPENVDGLNFLEGKSMSYVNEKAFEGTDVYKRQTLSIGAWRTQNINSLVAAVYKMVKETKPNVCLLYTSRCV